MLAFFIVKPIRYYPVGVLSVHKYPPTPHKVSSNRCLYSINPSITTKMTSPVHLNAALLKLTDEESPKHVFHFRTRNFSSGESVFKTCYVCNASLLGLHQV